MANDGTTTSAAATVTVTINGANDAPVSGGVASASGTEDDVAIAGSVPAASDVDVEALTYALTAAAPAGVTFNTDGTFSVAPLATDQALDSGESRVVTFDYVANDGTTTSAAATVTVTINGANDAPVAVADSLAATEDTPVTYTAVQLLGNDTDVDGNPLTIASVTSGTGGTAVLNVGGTVTFTPTLNFNGAANFSYKANDGTVDSNSATVTVTVAPTNDAPVAVADNVIYATNSSATATLIPSWALFNNDSDVDSPASGWTLAALTNTVTTGTATISTTDVSFVGLSSNSADTFTYTLRDGDLVISNAATVTVTRSNVTSLAGTGNDDIIIGDLDDETLNGSNGNDILIGNAGADTLKGGAGNDTVDGGDGNDMLDFSDATSAITFTLVQSLSFNSVDLSSVGLGIDTYKKMEGVIGSGSDDVLTGSDGNDTITGGAGNDTLTGGAGNDTINVNSGTDAINDLGNGSDVLVVSSGATANATVYTSGFTATAATQNNGGTATLNTAGYGVDLSLVTTGSAGFTVSGTTSTGMTLKGSALADTITGGTGNDTITGGAGADVMSGGTGTDTFFLNLSDSGAVSAWTNTSGGSTVSTTALDKITVVNGDNDVIDLSSLVSGSVSFSNLNRVTSQITNNSSLGGSANVTTYTGTYDTNTNLFTSTVTGSANSLLVVYDTNGNTSGTTFQAVVLVGVTDLTASNLADGTFNV